MRLDKRLLSLVKNAPTALGLAILAGLAAGIITVLQARMLSHVIQRAFLQRQGLDELSGILIWIAAAVLLRGLLAFVQEVAGNAASGKIRHELRTRLFAHLLNLGPAYTREERTGELVNAAVEGIESIDAYFSQYLPQIVLSTLVPVGMLVLIFPIEPLSAFILMVTAPLIPVFMVLIGSASDSLAKKQWLSLSRMSAYFLDVIQGLKTLKLLGRSREQAQQIEVVSEQFRQATMRVLRVSFLSALALEMLATISTALVAVEVGLRLLYGRLEFEQALFVLILAPEFYQPLRTLGARFHAAVNGAAASERIFAITSVPADRQPPGGSEIPSIQSIRFDNISYDYPDGRSGLKDASFTIEAGKMTVLAGPSGAGKTTASGLLLRFFEPQAGTIWVGERRLSELPVDLWRDQIAWVPQNPYLFAGTIAENISLANENVSSNEIVAAAKAAHLHEFIIGLPDGYNTRIGERGARLSGGQKRLLALARAFLRNAPVLILDEPAASLDLASEALLEDSLAKLLTGKTVIVIAHSQRTLLQAGRVVWFDAGKVTVVEKGATAERWQTGPQPVLGDSVETLVPAAPISKAAPDPTGKRRSAVRVLWGLLGLLKPYAGWVVLSVLLGFATFGSSVGLMASSAYIISKAALQPSIAEIQVAIVGVRFFGISRGLMRYLERYVSHQVTFKLLGRLRVWLFRKLEPLAPARLLTAHSGDLTARLLGDVALLENFYVRAAAPPLSALLLGLAAAGYLTIYDLRLGALLLIFLALGAIGLPILSHRLSRTPSRNAVQARSRLSTALVDGIQGMADLLAFGRGLSQQRKVDALSKEWKHAQSRLSWITGLENGLIVVISHLGMLSLLAVSIRLAQVGRVDPLYLAVIALAALASFEAVQNLPAAARTLAGSLEAGGRLFELVDGQPLVQDPPQPLETGAETAIEFRQVTFSYPQSEQHALEMVSFRLPPRKRVALVGAVGSGKSTLVSLLMRFWETDRGQICLNGQDIRAFRQEDVRKSFAVSEQEAYLFNASLRDNIRLGNPKAGDDRIEAVAQKAQLQPLLERLPDGFRTWVGEQGLNLSAGERQRVAVARALASEARVLIFDEPTAHLDPDTEQKLVDAILAEDRSILWISHRLTGMEQMDEILVMDAGKIVERGTHDQLLAMQGRYAALWKLGRSPEQVDVT